MAITYKSGNRLVGLSTDEKPRTKLVEGSTFEETDTGRRYFLRSSAWTERATADNLYEQMHDYSSPAKQHFFEFFWDIQNPYGSTGNAQSMPVHSRWKGNNLSGTNTFIFGGGNSDWSDHNEGGGLALVGAQANANQLNIGFNDIRPFDSKGSVYIGICKRFDNWQCNKAITFRMGGIDDHDWSFDGGSAVDHALAIADKDNHYQGFYSLVTGNSSGGGTARTDFPIDFATHVHKVECKSSTVEYSIDGTLAVTESGSTIPAQTGFQPTFSYRSAEGGFMAVTLKYMECYNT